MEPILKDFPESFETERLLIRSPMPGDGPALHEAVRESLTELKPWMAWIGNHRTVEGSEKSVRRARIRFLERSELRMHLFLKSAGTFIGSSGLQNMDWKVPSFEIGYWLRAGFTGGGYATEAVRAITAFAFDELGAKRVEVLCDPRNEKSIRVAQRCGFYLEGELRNHERAPDGSLRNILVYSMLPNERKALTD